MKRIRSVLRGREGMTLVELVVSAGLYFELDESGRTVTATVTIFRDAAMTDAVFSDSLLIDLRYDIPVKTGVTAQQRPAA